MTTVQEASYIGTIPIYYWDTTGNSFIVATTNRGPAIFGAGYVGGGDIKTVMQDPKSGNQSIAYLSIGDAKGITGTVWSQMVAFNGQYPIANFAPGLAAPYDYSPIINGKYSFWAYEMLDWPKSSQWTGSGYTDQNLSFTQLNNIMNKLSGTGTGSVDNEVLLSEPGGATAIRLSEMTATRTAVGGPIAP